MMMMASLPMPVGITSASTPDQIMIDALVVESRIRLSTTNSSRFDCKPFVFSRKSSFTSIF
jgi:hypothetical protein